MYDIDQGDVGASMAVKDRSQAEQWLDAFEAALGKKDASAIETLFQSESHWRDLLAFTWHLTPCLGAAKIAAGMVEAQQTVKARGFKVSATRTAPRRVRRLGIDVIETIFEFETETGRGNGILRLPVEGEGKAWVLLTALDELKGHEEHVGARRPTGDAYSRNFGGENWQDQRDRREAYADREPTVLVVGGGQAGLGIAARLNQLDVDTLVVDQLERVGDCWRKRYHSLALHNQIQVNHLPYLPFPGTWPKYIPKDMLGNWFEYYAGAMEINFWTGTKFVRGTYDDDAKCWTAVVRKQDGTERTLRPRHIIFANGVSGIPREPSLPGMEDFAGTVVHSHSFGDGSAWKGKKALVVGTGTSGFDITQDLHSHGADTTIIQRGSGTVVSIDPSAKLNYALYDEGLPTDDTDLIAAAATYPLIIKGYQLAVERMVEFDKELIKGLIARGFKFDIGEDKTGHQMKYRRRGGGYYLDAGCSALVISGDVGLMQFDTIDRFVAEGALLKDGTVVPADLIVLATGYYTQQELVRRVLGEDVAERIGPVWGIGDDGEMANMWKRTPQDGLWFMAGSLAQCRIYSKYLALQIKAQEEGLLGRW